MLTTSRLLLVPSHMRATSNSSSPQTAYLVPQRRTTNVPSLVATEHGRRRGTGSLAFLHEQVHGRA